MYLFWRVNPKMCLEQVAQVATTKSIFDLLLKLKCTTEYPPSGDVVWDQAEPAGGPPHPEQG